MSKRIEALIAKKREKIKELTAQIAELINENVLKSKSFVEISEVRKVKVNGKKVELTLMVGYRTWKEDFVDEDSGEVVTIDRKEMVAINGVRVDPFYRKLSVVSELVERSAEKTIWEEEILHP